MADPGDISSSLLDRVRTGQESAWSELIDRLSPQVFSIIRNQIRQSSDHEDLAQEAFTKIFLKLNQFDTRRPFRNWVSRIVINTCYDWLRRQKARPLVSYADLSENQTEFLEKNLTKNTHDAAEKIEATKDLLNRLIATLNPREQIIIRLLDLEEKSVLDICDLTGWGQSKVKVTAMRARKKLAEHIKKLKPDY